MRFKHLTFVLPTLGQARIKKQFVGTYRAL